MSSPRIAFYCTPSTSNLDRLSNAGFVMLTKWERDIFRKKEKRNRVLKREIGIFSVREKKKRVLSNFKIGSLSPILSIWFLGTFNPSLFIFVDWQMESIRRVCILLLAILRSNDIKWQNFVHDILTQKSNSYQILKRCQNCNFHMGWNLYRESRRHLCLKTNENFKLFW